MKKVFQIGLMLMIGFSQSSFAQKNGFVCATSVTKGALQLGLPGAGVSFALSGGNPVVGVAVGTAVGVVGAVDAYNHEPACTGNKNNGGGLGSGSGSGSSGGGGGYSVQKTYATRLHKY